MKNLYNLILVLVLFTVIRPSYQTTYSCNTSASCGCSTSSSILSRIVGGESATTGSWGWAVSILIANSYLCGGSIISSSWVITAAHCVLNFTASQVVIYAGSSQRFAGTQTKVASQIIIHSSYSTTTYLHDIALLKLATPLTMSDPYVRSICIPSVNSTTSEWPAAGTTVVAIGWGKLSETGLLPSTLQQVTLQTVSYQAFSCRTLIGDWHTQLCAGVPGSGKGVCNGDSGGPLMMFSSSNQWILIGLTSYGSGCADATYSAVYTRVSAYESWINSNTNGSLISADSVAYSATSSSSLSSSSSVSSSTTSTRVIRSQGNNFTTIFCRISVIITMNFIAKYYIGI